MIILHLALMSHSDGPGPAGGRGQRTLSPSERALAAMPVGLGTALGTRPSRVRDAGDKGKMFLHKDSRDRSQDVLLCPSLEGF